MKKIKLLWWFFKRDKEFYGYLLDCLYYHENSMYSSKFKSEYERDIELNRDLQYKLKELYGDN
jgi:hypothetical protein